MSSWLPRSVASSLTVNPAAGNEPVKDAEMFDQGTNSSSSNPSSPQERSVKEDLSEIKNSLARKLRGVATFLAPPPQANSKPFDESESEKAGLKKIDGIRSDFAEIGGKVKAGISKLLQIRPDDNDEGKSGEYDAMSVVGVTEELLAFVKDLVGHPRTWVRFPLPEDFDDFVLNDSQQAHAGAMERLIPELGELRWELCPDHMLEGRFWMIYFVLVHPKLDKYDALSLSTPKINEARAMLTQESKQWRKVKQTEGTSRSSDVQDSPLRSIEPFIKDAPIGSFTTELSTAERPSADLKTPNQERPSDVNSPNDNQAPKEASIAVDDPKHLNALSDGSSLKVLVVKDEDDGDDWLNEETPVEGNSTLNIPISSNDDDVSFSDLEEDDDVKGTKSNK
ncbi:unnamed protein product [Rhodiola kirilowii]